MFDTNTSGLTLLDRYICVFGAACCFGLVVCETCFGSCSGTQKKTNIDTDNSSLHILLNFICKFSTCSSHGWIMYFLFVSTQQVPEIANPQVLDMSNKSICDGYNLYLTNENQHNSIYHWIRQHVPGVQHDVDTISGVVYLDYDIAICSRHVLPSASKTHHSWVRSWHHDGWTAHYDCQKGPSENWRGATCVAQWWFFVSSVVYPAYVVELQELEVVIVI